MADFVDKKINKGPKATSTAWWLGYVLVIVAIVLLGCYLLFGPDLRPCTSAPGKPLEGSFSITSRGLDVSLVWSKVSKATNYRLYLTTGQAIPTTSNFGQVIVIDAATSTYSFKGVSGESYNAILTAVNACGESKPTSVRRTTVCELPKQPSQLNVVCTDTLNWTFAPAPDAAYYSVEVLYDTVVIASYSNLDYQSALNIIATPSVPCIGKKVTVTVTAYSVCGGTASTSFKATF